MLQVRKKATNVPRYHLPLTPPRATPRLPRGKKAWTEGRVRRGQGTDEKHKAGRATDLRPRTPAPSHAEACPGHPGGQRALPPSFTGPHEYAQAVVILLLGRSEEPSETKKGRDLQNQLHPHDFYIIFGYTLVRNPGKPTVTSLSGSLIGPRHRSTRLLDFFYYFYFFWLPAPERQLLFDP